MDLAHKCADMSHYRFPLISRHPSLTKASYPNAANERCHPVLLGHSVAIALLAKKTLKRTRLEQANLDFSSHMSRGWNTICPGVSLENLLSECLNRIIAQSQSEDDDHF